MATFVNTLKTYFFGDGTKKLSKGSRICLLDASGNPIGSDDINSIAKLFDTKEDVVDMGLPSGTLWAKKNIGATSPTGYGWYFSWGNLDAHQEGAGYDFSQETYNATDAASISANLLLSQDAARANLGAPWKMPSTEQFVELFANIKYINADGTEVDTTKTDKRVTVNGVVGIYIESLINGKRLFFPCSGYGDGRSWGNRGVYGIYWSSTFNSARYARALNFYSGGVLPQDYGTRYRGFALRPVR